MKILVSDFDNTLYSENYYENIRKINEFVDNGNIFIIATGRNFNHLRRDLNGVYLKFDYLICNDGAIIFDKNFQIIKRTDINPKTVDQLIEELRKSPNIIETITDDGFNYFRGKTDNNNVVLGRYIDPIAAQHQIQEMMKKYPDIQGYLSSHWINIISRDAGKGTAINYLSELLNWDKNNIYTVGDGINDISMNQMFKGYCIEGISHPELIKVSQGTVKSVKALIDIIQ